MKSLECPVKSESEIASLRAGEWITLSGTIYIMRDSTHYRIFEENKTPPPDLKNSAVLHAAPSFKKEGDAFKILTVGPTTSMRMEKYTAPLLDTYGPKLIIGKGGMGTKTIEALKRNKAVYLEHVGGTSALLLSQIQGVSNVWWEDLLGEALWEVRVKDMGPMMVAIDSEGNDVFDKARKNALAKLSTLK